MKGLSSRAGSWARQVLGRRGYRIIRIDRRATGVPRDAVEESVLPPGATAVLRADHPRLLELQRRYHALDSHHARHTLWVEAHRSTDLDLARFRADNVYLWQLRSRSSPSRTRHDLRSQARIKFFLYGRYVQELDHRSLLDRLREDGLFGCWTFSYETLPPVSRDLLDSINELYFLDRELGLFDRDEVRVLDIGAGYGRLAHRMHEALPHLSRYYCVDAVPESTFLSEFYVDFRGCGDDVVVVPLDEMAGSLPAGEIDLAVNIHSFSETGLDAIRAWLGELRRLRIPWLLIVPNDADELLSWEGDGSRRDYAPLLAEHGYRLRSSESTIRDENLRELLDTNDQFLLYEHRGEVA